MNFEYLMDYPLSFTLFYALSWLGLFVYLAMRFFFSKSTKRLKRIVKEGSESQNSSSLNIETLPKKGTYCVCSPKRSTRIFLSCIQVLALVGVGLLCKVVLEEAYIIETTPVHVGQVVDIKSVRKRGSKGRVYYIYHHLVKGEHQSHWVSSRKRYGMGKDFSYHISNTDPNEWIEHSNSYRLVMTLIIAPFVSLLISFTFYYLRLMSLVSKALEKGKKFSVSILEAYPVKVKNNQQIHLWFLLEEVLYLSVVVQTNKKELEHFESLKGSSVEVCEVPSDCIKFWDVAPWKSNPSQASEYRRSMGREKSPRFLVLNRNRIAPPSK
ncbi:MAG: hypothetical protein CME63_14480 [Halobacteriovoraceae bacterium]|nr:hypothetical protein [Halobacteriovoraceae bacterium]|tara:strand:- start:4425 stop:5396 length:972 start_codon:yes stop_codon:yes gene_type:complete